MTKFALIACVAAAQISAQAPPDYDFNFITIGAVGNAPYMGTDVRGRVTGRGSVNYEYRIARTEVRSDQYIEFLNGLVDAGVPVNLGVAPLHFGGGFDFDTGRWVVVPGFGDLPVIGVPWRNAALYMNWLHNDKVPVLDSFVNGAYDITTFDFDDNGLTDQSTRHPDAKYWIPSHDEWLKAAHYDPNKDGQGQGGWWRFNDSSDTQPTPGMPGVGETSAGLDVSDTVAYLIPLESYPETQTPWGLLDTSGGGAEWTEEWTDPDNPERRLWQGNASGLNTWRRTDPDLSFDTKDRIDFLGSDSPTFPFGNFSFRVASAVPAPGVGVGLMCGFGFFIHRRRRYE